MNLITANIKWVMLISGALTFTMVYAVIAPEAALTSTFGEPLHGPVAEVVVRNWGALIALIGGMLIYGLRDPLLAPGSRLRKRSELAHGGERQISVSGAGAGSIRLSTNPTRCFTRTIGRISSIQG